MILNQLRQGIRAMQQFIQSLGHWDKASFRGIFDRQAHRAWIRWHRFITRSADGPWYAIWGAVLLAARPLPVAVEFILAGLLAFGIELPLYKLIKQKTRRRRPFHFFQDVQHRILPPDHFSFPSGHTASAFIMASLWSAAFPALSVPLYLWAALVGLSRIALGVHFPSDVLAGMALGLLSSYCGRELAVALINLSL